MAPGGRGPIAGRGFYVSRRQGIERRERLLGPRELQSTGKAISHISEMRTTPLKYCIAARLLAPPLGPLATETIPKYAQLSEF